MTTANTQAWTLPDPLPEPGRVAQQLLALLTAQASAENVAGMARYGISSNGTLGVPMSVLRPLAAQFRPLQRSDPTAAHAIASELWSLGGHETRILAGLIDVPALVTSAQANSWVADFDSWDVCDQVCKLFAASPIGYHKAVEWAGAEPEFVKRAGFVTMCSLAVHDKKAPDERLTAFLPLAVRESDDDRNFVKKAISWAIRQIGKRSAPCHEAAIKTCEEILAAHPDSRSARWIARDALRELTSEKVLARVGR